MTDQEKDLGLRIVQTVILQCPLVTKVGMCQGSN